MKKIDAERLKTLRGRRGWSQEELAEKTKSPGQPKIDKQTISRFERGIVGKTRGRTIEQLARALGVEPAVLTAEAPLPETKSEPTHLMKTQLNVRINRAARNSLILVAQRYSVEPWQIVELAPFLFCCAAEASLRRRKEMIDEFERTRDELSNLALAMPHVPAPYEVPFEDKMIAAERQSIDLKDLFAVSIYEETGFFAEPDAEYPFAVYLRSLAKELGDDAEFEGWEYDSGPAYTVCHESAANLVGGDGELSFAILQGFAALNEMPKDIYVSDKVKERTDWVLANAKAFQEQLKLAHAELANKEVPK